MSAGQDGERLMCMYCGGRVEKASWYHYLPFVPLVLIQVARSGRLYKHRAGLFTECRAYLLAANRIYQGDSSA